MDIRSWLNKIIKKLRETFWNTHQMCYEEMESLGIAVFGSCGGLYGGDRYSNYLQYQCMDCPYFVDLTENEGGKNEKIND